MEDDVDYSYLNFDEELDETYDDRDRSFNDDELYKMDKEDLLLLCKNSIDYSNTLELRIEFYKGEMKRLRNALDYYSRDPSYREKVLSRKLATKIQEVQELEIQITELSSDQEPPLKTFKTALLDPAVNIVVENLKSELSVERSKVEETRNELNSWKFTPNSNTGKKLMAKCRLLHQENAELGKTISIGRVAKLDSELALQKCFTEEVEDSQLEMDDLLQDVDEDLEGMQGTIYLLHKEMRKYKKKITATSGDEDDDYDDDEDDDEENECDDITDFSISCVSSNSEIDNYDDEDAISYTSDFFSPRYNGRQKTLYDDTDDIDPEDDIEDEIEDERDVKRKKTRSDD